MASLQCSFNDRTKFTVHYMSYLKSVLQAWLSHFSNGILVSTGECVMLLICVIATSKIIQGRRSSEGTGGKKELHLAL